MHKNVKLTMYYNNSNYSLIQASFAKRLSFSFLNRTRFSECFSQAIIIKADTIRVA